MNQKRGKKLLKYVSDYVVFDLETTGISVDRDDIIEISAVKVKNGQVIDTFETLVNPERHIPAGATQVNHITDAMVADAPLLEEAMILFMDFIGEGILVGHNINTFDMKFIYKAAEQLFDKIIPNDYIDTLTMARRCLPELSHHRLCDVSEHFQISTEGAHRALNDCIMNQKCYEKLGKIMLKKQADGDAENQEEEMPVCPKCGSILQKRNGKFGAFWGCSGYPDCRFTKNIM